MGIWSFMNMVTAICIDKLEVKIDGVFRDWKLIGKNKTLEKRILDDVLCLEFSEEIPKKLLPVLWFKATRW